MNILKGSGAIPCGDNLYRALPHRDRFCAGKTRYFHPAERRISHNLDGRDCHYYRCLYTVVGGYITAALAPNPPMRYVMILGLIGLVMSTLAAVATIPLGIAPAWYPIALAVTALPCVWLGGLLHRAKRAER